jgi:ABC-type glutathione transport system ATPase component
MSGVGLSVRGLDVQLGGGGARTRILRAIDLEVAAGTTVGVVGESGSGKSTLAKTIVGIHRPSQGAVLLGGEDVSAFRGRRRRALGRRVQLIPQDPYGSLDPRRTIEQTLAEAIDPGRASVGRHRARIDELLALVRLDPAMGARRPGEFSGGQRQRIAIARALAVEPEVVVADEITSALDVSTQAEVLALLQDLKQRLGLTMLFVSHNLAVVSRIAEEVVVLHGGVIVEAGPTDEVFRRPKAAYTRLLIDSVPGGPGFDLG